MKTLNKTSVLLVEDDVELRNTISDNLKAVDYKVHAARKGLEAWFCLSSSDKNIKSGYASNIFGIEGIISQPFE